MAPIASKAATQPMITRTTPLCDFDGVGAGVAVGVAVAVELTIRTGALRKSQSEPRHL